MSSAVRFHEAVPPPPREGWPRPVTFHVEEGDFALVATTAAAALHLIRLLVGLCTPAGGTVEVLGVHPAALDRWATQRFRRRLGVGFGDPLGLVSNLSLRMNLVVPMLYSGIADMANAHRRAADILAEFELQRWAETRPADVPPEVRREAVVARAAVRDPELLILEEPTGSLSDDRARWLLSLCRRRARTVVITTTEREGVQFEFADAVLTLDSKGVETSSHEVGVV